MRFMPASSRPRRKARQKVQRRLRWMIPAAVAGASVLAAPVLSGSVASAATGWTVETVPQTGNNTLLLGAAARTSTDAWAVGEQFAGPARPRRHRSATTGTAPRGRSSPRPRWA